MHHPTDLPEMRYINPGARILVAISGGVDSSVAALILKSQGFDVIGVTLGIWSGFPFKDAKDLADSLDIPHHMPDVTDHFEREIVRYFVDEYSQGRTPNPCVLCNAKIKFRYLLDMRHELGAEFVATGHYARISFDPGRDRFLLKKGKDATKDQSYVLYRLTQQDLSHILFPLGHLTKRQVREIALENNISAADKSESQEICFLSGTDYRDFLSTRLDLAFKPGPIMDISGRIIGEHRGLPFYTVGQRKGIGIPGSTRLYVTKIDKSENAIVVGEAEDLLSNGLEACDINWIAYHEPREKMRLGIKIRYNAKEVPGLVLPKSQDMAEVVFESPQRAVTPGQSVVFYDDDVVVGGGIIV
jgi:tRNA-specific 2-thiouridylase